MLSWISNINTNPKYIQDKKKFPSALKLTTNTFIHHNFLCSTYLLLDWALNDESLHFLASLSWTKQIWHQVPNSPFL